MSIRLVILAVAACLLAGCGVAVVPQPTPTTTFGPTEDSLAGKSDGVAVTVGVQDLEVAPYRMVDNITSFRVVIANESDREVTLPLSSFLLVDSEGNQYRPIEPSKIEGIVSRDSQYLIPYPYVGYYYLEDAVQASFFNTFDSSLPYYAENYPQEIYTEALPVDTLLPGNRISGLVYFVVDLALKESVEFRVYLPGTPGTAAPDLRFPFSIEK